MKRERYGQCNYRERKARKSQGEIETEKGEVEREMDNVMIERAKDT